MAKPRTIEIQVDQDGDHLMTVLPAQDRAAEAYAQLIRNYPARNGYRVRAFMDGKEMELGP